VTNHENELTRERVLLIIFPLTRKRGWSAKRSRAAYHAVDIRPDQLSRPSFIVPACTIGPNDHPSRRLNRREDALISQTFE
jgi:hypothetical protein